MAMQLMLGRMRGWLDVVVDLLAEQVDLQVQIGEALDELLGRLESHAVHSFLAPSGAGAALAFPGRGRAQMRERSRVEFGAAGRKGPGGPDALASHYRRALPLSQ